MAVAELNPERLLTPGDPSWDPNLQAYNLYHEGMSQLDRMIMGETQAKLGLLAAILTGHRAVFVGPPSGGKTDLAASGYRLVEGIEPDRVATIPPLNDLTAQQLVGGRVSAEKDITDEKGNIRKEALVTYLKGLIGPDTQGIFGNEFNRINPDVLVALLEVVESNRLDNSEGTSYLRDLDYVVATMNPVHNREGTYGIPSAWRSRFTIGAVLGVDPETNDKIFADAAKGLAQSFGNTKKAQPETIQPVVNIETLHKLREKAEKAIIVPDEIQPFVFRGLKLAHAGLHEALRGNFEEAPARFAYRTMAVAQGLALLRGNQESKLNEQDLVDAARYTIVARVGMSGYLDDAPQTVAENIIESITA